MMKEKNKKMRKFQIQQVVVIVISILCAIAFISYAIHERIQHLGNLNMDSDLVIAIVGSFSLVFGVVFAALIQPLLVLKKKEKQQINFQNLKEYLDGKEKQVWYRYGAQYEAKMLKNIANHYNLSYFVKVENDKIMLITKNDKGDVGNPIEISSSFFHQYFEF